MTISMQVALRFTFFGYYYLNHNNKLKHYLELNQIFSLGSYFKIVIFYFAQ